MTKILVETLPERHAAGPIDLARRFEWRLQWEKAQLENWQTYQQCGEQHSNDRSLGNASGKNLNELSERLSQPGLSTGKLAGQSETGRSHLEQTHPENLRFKPIAIPSKSPIGKQSTIAYSYSDGMRSTFSTSPRAVHNVRVTPVPFTQEIPSQAAHIYQLDGKVEVALRSAGMDEKCGAKLMAGLKKNLASLGLKLTRLILNGELFWASESALSISKSKLDRNETSIDKIY
jgi:hypothetical protein